MAKNSRKKGKGKKIFWTILIIILLILGFGIYYVGHSQIDDKFVAVDEIDIEEVLENVISESDFLEGKILISYADFNQILNEAVDFEEIDAISAATIKDAYYSAIEKKFVITLHSYFGNTSLMFDPVAKVEENKLKLSLINPKLGKWHIPLPINVEKLRKEYVLPESDYIEMEALSFPSSGVELDFRFKIEEIALLIESQKDKVKEILVEYIEEILN